MPIQKLANLKTLLFLSFMYGCSQIIFTLMIRNIYIHHVEMKLIEITHSKGGKLEIVTI